MATTAPSDTAAPASPLPPGRLGLPDPDRFAPERAEDQRRPNSYVPQGGPPEGHRCAGEALTDQLLRVYTALLLRDYTWEPPAQDLSLRMGGLVPVPRGGLQVIFRRA